MREKPQFPYGLGVLRHDDPRDKEYRALARVPLPSPVKLPKFKRYAHGPILNQGKTNACVGHAWRLWKTSSLLRTYGPPDEWQIYAAARRLDSFPENDGVGEEYDLGTTVRAGAKALKAAGQIGTYVWVHSFDELRVWMLSGRGTVVLDIPWYVSMFTTVMTSLGRSGDYAPFVKIRAEEGMAGRHAIVAVGLNDNDERLRLANSWGTSWGDLGRAWITYTDLELLMSQGGEGCMATEKRAGPAKYWWEKGDVMTSLYRKKGKRGRSSLSTTSAR